MRTPARLPYVLRWLGYAYNRLPARYRDRGPWRLYFTDGKLSAVKREDFDGWYWCERLSSVLPWRPVV